MAVNKVIVGGETVLDLSGDTVTPAQLAQGVTAHDASGNPILGLLSMSNSALNVKKVTSASYSSNAYSLTIPYARCIFAYSCAEIDGYGLGMYTKSNKGVILFELGTNGKNALVDHMFNDGVFVGSGSAVEIYAPQYSGTAECMFKIQGNAMKFGTANGADSNYAITIGFLEL